MIMPEQLRDFGAWLTGGATALFAIIKLVEAVISYVSSKTSGDVASFESVLKAHVGLLDDCRQSVTELRAAEHRRDELHAAAMAAKEAAHNMARGEWDRERRDHERDRHELYRRIIECEGIIRRHGWDDPRREPRVKKREA
jgi:hypothetical protein